MNVCAWDRDAGTDRTHKLKIGDHEITFYHIGIPSILAAGFKKNLIPMIRFNKRLYDYLYKYGSEYDVVHASDFDTAFPAYLLKEKKKYQTSIVFQK